MNEKTKFIMDNSEKYSAAELAEGLGVSLSTVYDLGNRWGLKFKKVYRRGMKEQRQKVAVNPEAKLKHQVPRSLLPDPAPSPSTTAERIFQRRLSQHP
jgi:Zn-dependent peptidase ImmA (M78 family)